MTLTFILSFGLISNHSSAQNELGLAVNPAILEVVGAPGESSSQEINIKNNGNNPLPIRFQSRSSYKLDELIDPDKQSLFDASSWISVDQSDRIIEANSAIQSEIKVNIPQGAQPGSRYASLAIRAMAPEQDSSSTSTQILPEISVLVLVNIPGTVKDSIKIEHFNVKNLSFNGQVPINITLANDGYGQILTQPILHIYRSAELVDTIDLSSTLVLPNTRRQIVTNWVAGDLFGSFRVDLEIRYGSPSNSITASRSTFITPGLYLLVILGMILIGVLYYFKKLALIIWKYIRPGRRVRPSGKLPELDTQPTSLSIEKIDQVVKVDKEIKSTQTKPKKINIK
jgi:hypothetical protein